MIATERIAAMLKVSAIAITANSPTVHSTAPDQDASAERARSHHCPASMR